MNPDEQQLNLLSIFHYVLGAIVGIFACLPILHLVMGLIFLAAPPPTSGPNPPPPIFFKAMGGIMVAFAAMFILLGWTLAGCLVCAGRCLARRRNRTFCLVIAGVGCLFMPLGTILGVFTIIVLMRPGVQAMFEGGAASPLP